MYTRDYIYIYTYIYIYVCILNCVIIGFRIALYNDYESKSSLTGEILPHKPAVNVRHPSDANTEAVTASCQETRVQPAFFFCLISGTF